MKALNGPNDPDFTLRIFKYVGLLFFLLFTAVISGIYIAFNWI